MLAHHGDVAGVPGWPAQSARRGWEISCGGYVNSAKPLICLSAPPRRPPEPSVDTYVHRAAPWRKADQLLICYYPLKRCLPASKQTLSWWIVDAINMSYESPGLPSPMGVKAHSTRSVAASKAAFAGVPLQDICIATGWSTPLTFVRFCGLDLQANPGSSVLSS